MLMLKAVRISELEAAKREAGAQAVRISELETAERNVGAAIQARDDRTAKLEEQINNAPSARQHAPALFRSHTKPWRIFHYQLNHHEESDVVHRLVNSAGSAT